jgi:hypothetical protein
MLSSACEIPIAQEVLLNRPCAPPGIWHVVRNSHFDGMVRASQTSGHTRATLTIGKQIHKQNHSAYGLSSNGIDLQLGVRPDAVIHPDVRCPVHVIKQTVTCNAVLELYSWTTCRRGLSRAFGAPLAEVGAKMPRCSHARSFVALLRDTCCPHGFSTPLGLRLQT